MRVNEEQDEEVEAAAAGRERKKPNTTATTLRGQRLLLDGWLQLISLLLHILCLPEIWLTMVGRICWQMYLAACVHSELETSRMKDKKVELLSSRYTSIYF